MSEGYCIYECAKCGYEPTWAEAARGVCPECREDKRIERERMARERKRKQRRLQMSPYALCEVSGRSAVVRRKYLTRVACERWAPHHGLVFVIVSPGTKVGERVSLTFGA